MNVTKGTQRSRQLLCKATRRYLSAAKRKAKRAMRRTARQELRQGKEPDRKFALTERQIS